MKKRENTDLNKNPMAIYEVHPGSWKKHPATEEDPSGFYNYRELAHALADYVKEMGYTHVELMGIAEHPFDGSWGYQCDSYYAPTSRYGTPEDFMYFINYMHRKKIGVILDWVPAHFPRDSHGLANFDGTCQYEYADPRKGEHPDWGNKDIRLWKERSKKFPDCQCAVLAGTVPRRRTSRRRCGVHSVSGLRPPRRRVGFRTFMGGNKNLEAIEFFKHLNSVVLGRNKGALMIAEESTAWPKVTGKPEEDVWDSP